MPPHTEQPARGDRFIYSRRWRSSSRARSCPRV
jgi:hypothetical protein